MVGGGPERSDQPSKKRVEKQTRKTPKKYPKIQKNAPKGTPWGGQKAANEPTFSSLFRRGPFRGALGAQGRQKTPTGTKMTPKCQQNDAKMTPKSCKNDPQNNKNERNK